MWKFISEIASLKSPWLQLVAERWKDDQGSLLDYWRIIGAHSVIVIPEFQGQYLLPHEMFRPGVGKTTLDFPGGRLPENMSPEQASRIILCRELSISEEQITKLSPICPFPLMVNSSASNQELFGFHAELQNLPEELNSVYRFTTDETGIQALMEKLDCLQCRALLLEHLRSESLSGHP